MPDVVPSGSRPLPTERLSPEVVAWALQLRELWDSLGVSMSRFEAANPIDKGTISRYLSGKRVPRTAWFLERLLAIRAEQGREVSQEVREHLTKLQLAALESAHPGEYRVRVVSDKLELAEISQRQISRYAESLEEQLAERQREIEELTRQKARLQDAWDADRAEQAKLQERIARLEQDVADLTEQLTYARASITDAEQRRADLEELLRAVELGAEADATAEGTRPVRKIPEVWGKVPPRNKNFTGRDELLDGVRASLTGSESTILPLALHGFGGVGKTQTAVEYAYRFRGEYDLVWWIPADQPLLVRSTLSGMAPYLGLPSAAVSGIEDAANAVLDSLRRGQPYAKWLLIFDNADRPEDLTDILPQGPGHVLVTSRNHRWEGVVDAVPVHEFTRSESVEFLRTRTQHGITPAEADRLAEELGDLPLALEQAGGLQAETGMSVDQYVELLTDRPSEILQHGKPSEYPASMTATWEVSSAVLREKTPEAAALLNRCAFFGTVPIPRDVFNRSAEGLSPEFAELLADPSRFSRTVGALGRYALARIDRAARTLQVHRLVQALVRESLPPEDQERLRHDVHLMLAAYAPSGRGGARNPAMWNVHADVLPHIGPTRLADCPDPQVRRFALGFVGHLTASGDWRSARAFAEDFIGVWTRDSGETHEDVLRMRLELTEARRELGEHQAAAELTTATLAVAERVLGGDHETTVGLLLGAAADQRATGDFQAARETAEQALLRAERTFGADDGMTLPALNGIALAAGLGGDHRAAQELHARAYQGWMGSPADDPVGCLTAWTGLARAVRLNGGYAEACDLGEDAYAYGVEHLGLDHPATLRTGKDLSVSWRRLGENERALELAEEIYGRFARRDGHDHADTLAAAVCLSNIYRATGRLEQARDLVMDTVRRYPDVYGPGHPFNAGCSGNLAVLLRVTGEPDHARRRNEDALTALEPRLGRDHPYSLTVTTNLASDLAALGRVEEAVRLSRDTTRRLRTLLGGEHPMALLAAANLVSGLRELGADDDAARVFEETRDGYARSLGVEHPDARVFLEGRRLDADFDPPPL